MEISDLDKKQNISISVAGNNFPLEINRDEEEFFRIAEKLLNKKVEIYEKKYSNKPRINVLSLAAYDLSVCLLRYCNSINGEQLAKKWRSFDEQIEEIL